MKTQMRAMCMKKQSICNVIDEWKRRTEVRMFTTAHA